MEGTEVFLPVRDYEGLYEVSNYGRVYNLKTKKFVQGSPVKAGYLHIGLCRGNGKPHFRYLHRMVIEAFNPTDDKSLEVNHIDGNKFNNAIDNLEWVTHKRNMEHASENYLFAEGNIKNRIFSEEQIIYIRTNYIKGDRSGRSMQGLADKFGVSPNTIYRILRYMSYREIKV